MKKFSLIFFMLMGLCLLKKDIVKAEEIGTIEFKAICEQSVYDNEYTINITVSDSTDEYYLQLNSIYDYSGNLSLPLGKYTIKEITILDNSDNIVEYKKDYEKTIKLNADYVTSNIYIGNVEKNETENTNNNEEANPDNYNLSTGIIQIKANVGEKIDKESTICVAIKNSSTKAENTYYLTAINEYEATESVQYGNYTVSEIYITDTKGEKSKEYYECNKTALVISDSPESLEINIGFDEITNNNESQIKTSEEWISEEDDNENKTISMINSTYNYQSKEEKQKKKISSFLERNVLNIILFIGMLVAFIAIYMSNERKKDAF